MGDRLWTVDELNALLDDRIEDLKASAAAFDGGAEREAVRLAATLRILLHDTSQCVSLLSRLKRKGIDWVDTAYERDPELFGSFANLLAMIGRAEGTSFRALLDDSLDEGQVHRTSPFD